MASRFSSFFIQSSYGGRGNFEVVSAPTDDALGFVHRWRDNDAASLPWRTTTGLGSGFRVQTPVLMQSERFSPGRLNVVARISDGGPTVLGHFERAVPSPWGPPAALPASDRVPYSGGPALFESSNGGPAGQFEVFAPLAGGGLVHYWRANNVGGTPWEHWGVPPGDPWRPDLNVDDLSCFESTFGRFEMLIRRGSSLEYTSKPRSGGAREWTPPVPIFDGAAGRPGFLQSRHGRNGNFEVVTLDDRGGLTFLWRNNDAWHPGIDPMSISWTGPFRVVPTVPSGERSDGEDGVGLIQSNYGIPSLGHLEFVVRRSGRHSFGWRIDREPWTWHGPYPLP